MTHIAVFFSDPNPEGPPLDQPGYRAAYQRLAECVEARGGHMTIVRGTVSFQGSGIFSRGWQFSNNGTLLEIAGPMQANVVFNKGEDFQADLETRLVNCPELDSLCRNKERTYEHFSSLMPTTTLVGNSVELRALLANTPSHTRVVIKPPNRWGGAGVVIDFSSSIQPDAFSYPLLLQEFVDTSAGIPSLCEGPHDLRCFMVNGVLAMSNIRIPSVGTLTANVARGAEVRLLRKEQVPQEPLRVAQEVDHALERYGTRIYSVDLGRDISSHWYILELNSQPGLIAPHRGSHTKELYAAIADALIAEALAV